MAGKKSFLDVFKMKDIDDEFEDDLFDDDDDEEEYVPKKKSVAEKPRSNTNSSQNSSYQSSYKPSSQSTGYQQPKQKPATSNKLVDFNSSKQQRAESFRGKSEVYVIKPQEISESQSVVDFLNNSKTIVINMEGLELATAQRIIDFIGGACYAIGGTLQAISANIFIAAPPSIEVSGDLREEILNEATVSPDLGRY